MGIKADFSKATGFPGDRPDEFMIRGIAAGEVYPVIVDVTWKYSSDTCLLSPLGVYVVPKDEQDAGEGNGLPQPPPMPDIFPDHNNGGSIHPKPPHEPDPEPDPEPDDCEGNVIPAPKEIGKVTTIYSRHKKTYDMPAGRFRIFKFAASIADIKYPIQIGNTPKSNQKHTVHALIKKGSRPTIADFKRTWNMEQSQSGAGGLYWKYNTGSQAEFIEITEPMEINTFYILLYNYGAKNVRSQRLTLAFWM